MRPLFKTCILLFFPMLMVAQGELTYHTEYFNNKVLKAEGWMLDGKKVKYWKHYNPYGVLKAEGHYENDKRTKYWFFYRANGKKLKEGTFSKGTPHYWWVYYDNSGKITERCQYNMGVKDGYRVVYVNEKPKKVEKFDQDTKVDQWTSYTSFVLDNGPLLKADD